MQSRPLTIITTRLPPQICGVGTFSWLLDRHWPNDSSQHRFLVVDRGRNAGSTESNLDVREFGDDWSLLSRALDEIGSTDLLLHYAGRAYQPLGCPGGLARALTKWKSKLPASRLIIFFHELPARLPLLNRHYWINLCSRSVARKLAGIADLMITNTAEHVATLQKISGRKDIRFVPVPSNIERTASGNSPRDRTEFAVFGLPYGRWRILEAFDVEIQQWVAKNLMTKLHLIGPIDEKFDTRSEALIRSYPNPNVVMKHGELSPDRISELLSCVQFALTTVDELTWSKSGTLMAFLAHECSIVSKNRSNLEPLVWNVAPEEIEGISLHELRSRTDAARRWYDTNVAWEVLARKISDWVSNLPPT